MIIAVNTRLNKEQQPQGYEEFMFGLLSQLTKKYPQQQFIYIFDKPFDDKLSFGGNVLPLIAGPETTNSLRLQYWFNYKVPALLRKHKADVFVSMEGICSMRTKKPQCLLISDFSFLHQPQLIKKWRARFLQKFTASFLAKVKSVATVSVFSKSVIVDRYKFNAPDIEVIAPGIDECFKPVDWEEKEIIKEKYAGGKGYFLFSGNVDQFSNLINLLKAFTLFKKRQKSSMMLLIAGNADDSFKKELKGYKFRNEVLLLENLTKEELANITAAAYAMIYPVLHTDLALPVLQAMQCTVPVVVSNTGALTSMFGDAALYTDPGSFKDIAENMMLVFKNEDKAKTLVNAGKGLLHRYNWGKSADLLIQSIQKAFNN